MRVACEAAQKEASNLRGQLSQSKAELEEAERKTPMLAQLKAETAKVQARQSVVCLCEGRAVACRVRA